MSKKIIRFRILSVLFALIVWEIVALRVNSAMLLASPLEVFLRLTTIWKEPDFWRTVFTSTGRILLGFFAAFSSGLLLGLVAGRFRSVEMVLWPYISAVKTVPVASFIILALIWLDYSSLTVLISFLMAFPAVYTNTVHGYRHTDNKLLEMAKVYGLSRPKQLLYIRFPSVKPFLLSACTVSMGLAWKSGVAAEVIGMADGTIGDMLYQAKIYFQNADLLCWTLIIVLLSIASEKLMTFLLNLVLCKC